MALIPFSSWILPIAVWFSAIVLAADSAACPGNATRLHLSDGPTENYLYFDCHSSSHVVVTSPLPDSNLSVIRPRFLVAWPAGNSGIVSVFVPENGKAGTLGISLANSTSTGEALEPIYDTSPSKSGNPRVGVSGQLTFNSPAVLTVPILGSIRSIRDYTEGGEYTNPTVQDAIQFSSDTGGGATLSRLWADNVTTTYLALTPSKGADKISIRKGDNTTLRFGAGTYAFEASFDYPQLKQLFPLQVLNENSTDLTTQMPDQTTSLSFLSYTNKLLAGTWRFLTYFGRDTMISLLLMQPVLSEGEGGAVEAAIGSVLERINKTDGSACHEEIIGDYATLNNLENNFKSTAPYCDYKMIDTDYYLPIVMKNYLVDSETGQKRASAFLNTKASFFANNSGLTYAQLAEFTASKIMRTSLPFASKGGQTQANLIHLKAGQEVGQWRDSWNGIGGGRIPFDVNTALVPAALRAIAALSRAGLFSDHPQWNTTADQYADIWEDNTLQFFEVSIPPNTAKSLINTYVKNSSFPGPSNTDNITDAITFYGLALDGESGTQPIVRVMNTDDCFRHFLLNTTNQTQLTHFLNQTADHILQPFPVGLSTSVGLFVANPAYGGNAFYTTSFTKADYHGTVVWGWPLAMMAAGLARQLGRCEAQATTSTPEFCKNEAVYTKLDSAYTHLWTIIAKNSAQLSTEVWSWEYTDGDFDVEPIGALSETESNIRQLWSLSFLAVGERRFGSG